MQPVTLSGALRNFLPKFSDALSLIQDSKDAFEAQLAAVAKQTADLGSMRNDLDHQLGSLKSIADAAAKGAVPKYDPKTGKVTLSGPPGTPPVPGSPTVTVDTHKGNVTVPVFGCIGFHC
jgi:hypothetical protein